MVEARKLERSRKAEEKHEAARLSREAAKLERKAQTAELQAHKDMWPNHRFEKEVDLFPFPPAILSEARESYQAKFSTPVANQYDFNFWRYVYHHYADHIIPFWNRMDGVVYDPSSRVIPTLTFPWSVHQLQEVAGLPDNRAQRSVLISLWEKDPEFRRALSESKALPAFRMVQVDMALKDQELLHDVATYQYTECVPWAAEKILHFLLIFLPREDIPVSSLRKLTPEDEREVRMTLIRHWPHQPLLRAYVSNLIPKKVTQLTWRQVVPFDQLLIAYSAWDKPNKELPQGRLMNLFFNDVLIRSYQFYKNSFPGGLTYLEMLQNFYDHTKEYDLKVTGSGILLLRKPDINQLVLQNMQVDDFRTPLKWTKSGMRAHVGRLLEVAAREVKKGQRGDDKDSEEDDESELGDANQKIMGIYLRTMMKRMDEISTAWNYFLNTLFRSDFEFRRFTSAYAASDFTLKELYIRHGSKKGMNQRYEELEAKRVTKLRKDLRNWALSSEAPGEALVQSFEQDARGMLRQNVPLLANSQRYQKFIRKQWKKFTLPEVSFEPESSNCDSRAFSDKKQLGRFFLTPDGAQFFMSADFTPASPMNGRIAVHSVGSGKTCMAVRIASEFSRAGFEIVWATKTSLKNQVYKNHVTEICNTLIQNEYDRLRWTEGEEAADHWLKHKVPKETSFSSVVSLLKSMGMHWTNMSYRQLSNALEEPEPLNDIGRRWKQEAVYASIGEFYDPLRKKLIIIDEMHKMFTGELDRTELPNVEAIKDKMQASYRISGDQRCRTLMLTATPTPSSVLPLLTMINMLHAEDVFPGFNMATIDPHVRMEDGLVEHMAQVKETNRQLETKVACSMFPTGMAICDATNGERKGSGGLSEEEDPTDEEVNAYFNAKSIIGPQSFSPSDLTNNLEEFWQKAFSLISYYNISADYSRFPRTEYKPIIMPSASRLQERLISRELVSSKWRELGGLARKVRQISAWAVFQSNKSESRTPDRFDQVILEENAKTTFFEPTVQDLEQRRGVLMQIIEEEQSAQPNPQDQRTLEWYTERQKQLQAEYDALDVQLVKVLDERSLETSDDPKPVRQSRKSAQGTLTRAMNKLRKSITEMDSLIQTVEGELKFFETQKVTRLKFFERKLQRVESRLAELKRRSRREPQHRHKDLEMFLEPVEEEKLDREKEKQLEKDLQEDEYDAIVEAEEVENDLDEQQIEELEEDVAADEKMELKARGADFYMRKTWSVQKPGKKQMAIMKQRPKNPKKHYFDQPRQKDGTGFDARQFLKDLPLYSPKAAKTWEVIQEIDKNDKRNNPEEKREDRHRKIMIFCEDLHAIRAVAGTLMAHGWEFGMKREWVSWTKTYYNSKTQKKLGQRRSKTSQLTWLPAKTGGKEADYKRFLVLTRSTLGGVSGAPLNEHAIQTIGAKGEDATYNSQENSRGKDWRVIIIDRNFVEGIDLPSTYALLFDPVLSQSKRTQVVGRISRFCGNKDLPFVPNYGWPQTVYRFGLKFHKSGLSMTSRQEERLRERLRQPKGPFADVIPERYSDGFVSKITGNLFSPVELQVLLDGNMEVQRLRKRTLDVYEALLERVNIGSLLYAPAMKNLKHARDDLQEILLEEEETEREYKEDIFSRDRQRQSRSSYNLRSQKKDLLQQWQVDDGQIFQLLQYHVKHAMRRTTWDNVEKWEDPARLERFFTTHVKPDMRDANFITVSETVAQRIMTEMFAERVKDVKARREERDSKRNAIAAEKVKKSRDRVSRAASRAEKKMVNDIKKAARRAMGSRNLGIPKLRRHPEFIEDLWRGVQGQMPDLRRIDFDNVLVDMLRKRSRKPSQKSASRDSRAESRHSRAESRESRAESRHSRAESRDSRAESRESRAESSVSRHTSSSKTKPQTSKRKTKSATVAYTAMRKNLGVKKRVLQKDPEARRNFFNAVLQEYPGVKPEELEQAIAKWLT